MPIVLQENIYKPSKIIKIPLVGKAYQRDFYNN